MCEEQIRVIEIFQRAIQENRLTEELIWDTLEVFAGTRFYTSKGIEFTYTIHGYEMFVSRKKKTITKSTVMLAVKRAQELRRAGEKITGPKKLGTYGASYLFPIFKRFGLIEEEH